jgi:prepilin-type N-terminal cleavage/methylation domain-containing protein
MRARPGQRGFTLIEIMMVVALIAVLAAIAIPNFVGQSNKAKADAEVTAIFAELRMCEERYRAERGSYLAKIGRAHV